MTIRHPALGEHLVGRIRACAKIRSQYQHQDHFVGATRGAIRARKMFCHRAAVAKGIGKVDERDIRDKI